MARKGQVAVELFALIGALILIFSVLAIVERDRNARIYSERMSMDAKRVCETVSNEINVAVIVGDGYSHNFTLPSYIAANAKYDISVDGKNQFAWINWSHGQYLMPIITSNVSGTPQPGLNGIFNRNGTVNFGWWT